MLHNRDLYVLVAVIKSYLGEKIEIPQCGGDYTVTNWLTDVDHILCALGKHIAIKN